MPRADATLTGAVEVARAAAIEIAEPGAVGEHQGAETVAERLVTHFFDCTSAAYPGWRWAVTMARAPRARTATVSETHLVPGEQALLSPAWLPYEQRLAPGDIGAGDVTPYQQEDPNLEAGYEASGSADAEALEDDVDRMALFELGLGRQRVLSPEGRERAAQRWYDGAHGPSSDIARTAKAPCATCGYFVPMAGALRPMFGVCANAWSPSDGSVVSLDHGCGAHSEVDVAHREPEHVGQPVLDDNRLEIVES